MFPKAHIACSCTSSELEDKSWTKIGTAPESMTMRVWTAVPLAILVNAHAASNCNVGLSVVLRNSTNLGTIPVPITSSIGGLGSRDNNFRNL